MAGLTTPQNQETLLLESVCLGIIHRHKYPPAELEALIWCPRPSKEPSGPGQVI